MRKARRKLNGPDPKKVFAIKYEYTISNSMRN